MGHLGDRGARRSNARRGHRGPPSPRQGPPAGAGLPARPRPPDRDGAPPPLPIEGRGIRRDRSPVSDPAPPPSTAKAAIRHERESLLEQIDAALDGVMVLLSVAWIGLLVVEFA